jgi:hypothetical protein
MDQLFANLKIKVNGSLFLIDPNSSNLGKNIIAHSIDLIDEIGFEKFTFRKLGEAIESPEASIYRYFKSKNQLLSYLVSWYWGWMEYQLVFATANIQSPEICLQKAIDLISLKSNKKEMVDGIEVNKLMNIIISESSKSYLTKEVDQANKEGAYLSYKQFVARMASIVIQINPEYKFPNMLISTIIEGAHLQFFFAEHLPRLTNKQKSPNYISQFYKSLALESIKKTS